MADKKISELDAAEPLDGTELLEAAQDVGGTLAARKVTTQQVADLASASAGTPPVVTEGSAGLAATPANAGNYTRFTSSGAKAYTFDSAETYVVGAEYHGRNAGAGDLTIA